MHIISKTTIRVEPLCGWSGNPMEGVIAIHINKRNLKFEKDQIVIFHTWKIVQHQKRIPNSLGQSWKFNTQKIENQEQMK